VNFLDLCRRVALEAGVSDSGPPSTSGQRGEYLRIVEWTRDAHLEISTLHQDWTFLRTRDSFATVSGTKTYTTDNIGIEGTFSRWVEGSFRASLASVGRADEQPLDYWLYDQFREVYDFGAQAANTGRPTAFAVLPDDFSIILAPTPNAVFDITFEYWKQAVALSANADTPAWSPDLHMIIVWRALMSYGEFESAPEAFTRAKNNYRRMLQRMRRKYLPQMRTAPPLVR